MKRFLFVAAFLIFLIPASVTAQQVELISEMTCELNHIVWQRIIDNKIVIRCYEEVAPTPDPTATTEPTPTPTPEPPTPTPEPVGNVEPYADAPKCADELHDPRAWHGLWNYEHGCHYDHEHKDNPHAVDDIFGTDYYDMAGGEISYPWQTPNENTNKHEGYGWLVRRDLDCVGKGQGCMTDLRVQYHAIFAGTGAVTRYHSYWYEARVCMTGTNNCGIVRNGGWLDYGYLSTEIAPGTSKPYPCTPTKSHPNPDAQEFPCVIDLGDGINYANVNHPTGPKRQHGWSPFTPGTRASSNWYGHNRGTAMVNKVALNSVDVWHNIDSFDPGGVYLGNPTEYNGSTMELHQFSFFGDRRLDGGGDNVVNFEGYTDRYGQIVEGCTEVGLDCVPLSIVNLHVPADDPYTALYEYVDDQNGYTAADLDYDVYFNGESSGWIEYPN